MIPFTPNTSIPQNDICITDVYYVQDEQGALDRVAICPKIRKNCVEWYDTTHVVARSVAKIEIVPNGDSTPEKIVIFTKEGNTISLTKLNKTLYDKEIKPWVMNKPELESTQSVKDFYLKIYQEAGRLGG